MLLTWLSDILLATLFERLRFPCISSSALRRYDDQNDPKDPKNSTECVDLHPRLLHSLFVYFLSAKIVEKRLRSRITSLDRSKRTRLSPISISIAFRL